MSIYVKVDDQKTSKNETFFKDTDVFTYYRMQKRVHGLCLILNNEVYHKGPPREGSQKDVATLTALFADLGFDVILKENLTLNDMNSTLKEFSQDARHEASEMCVIISLSHGRLGQLQIRGAVSLVPRVLVHPQFSKSVKNCHMKMQ